MNIHAAPIASRGHAIARRLLPLAAGATLAAIASTSTLAQQWRLLPGNEVLAGEPVSIAVTGLKPGTEVMLRATRQVREWAGATRAYQSEARFNVSAFGVVDLEHHAPLPGSSWQGVDRRGLLWSMRPLPADAAGPAGASGAPNPPEQVHLQALVDGQPVAEQVLTLRRQRPEVVQQPADPAAFPGAVYAHLPGGATPAGATTTRRPALILLGGSEGGSLITRDAPIYASRGFAVLALPYYSPPQWGPGGPGAAELPTLPPAFADIPVERLQAARDWLARQPEVDATRIGVVGTSKGAELALLAGTRLPWIKAIAAIVPSDVVWEGWGPGVAAGTRSSFAWQGQPLPYVPYKDFDKEFEGFTTGKDVKIRRPQDAGRAANPERVAPARIRVEDINAPLFLAGADDDQIWDSGGMARSIAATRQARGGLVTVALVYPDAGHFLGGTGTSPTTQYNAGTSKAGGSPAANARAQAEVFARQFEFLRQHLGPVPDN